MMLDSESRTITAGKHIFRLAALLYLAFLILPEQAFLLPTASAAEYGIGGSVVYEEDIDDQAVELIESYDIIIEPDAIARSRMLFYDSYSIQRGDNISTLAVTFGLNQDSILSVNKIRNSRLLQIGKVLIIPNQDGILHTVTGSDTLDSIAEKHKVEKEAIKTVNELFSEKITSGTDLFIPGAKLDFAILQEINGDLFVWPVRGAITSPYGYRRDPFNTSRRQFHTGIDIRASHGTPVRAAMPGRVSQVGFDRVLGNFIIINHHSGYRTLYAHLSSIRTRAGAFVAINEHIGNVGSTGLSTGAHLHFTVYKNGVTVNPRTLMR